MINRIIFTSSIVCFLIGQVAPYQTPNSLELIEKGINNKFVWKKDYNFESDRRVIVNFDSNNCFDELFLINSKGHYSGPYNAKFVSKTNPFKAKDLTIQVSSFSHCEIDDINFIIEDYKENINQSYNSKIYSRERENPVILITGYWPPTNEMIRDFSQSFDLNPSGWIGDNWENRGYDIVSFFPEFDDPDCTSCGQGYGNLEVDYQDTSEDFWRIIEEVKPSGIITFSRGFNNNSWELENNVYNWVNWYADYTSPLYPTPSPPDDSYADNGNRGTALPITLIEEALDNSDIPVNCYVDQNGDAGRFLSEFMGYHGMWYHQSSIDTDTPCLLGGHIHVGGQLSVRVATDAAELTIETVIEYLDNILIIPGDINDDETINIQDVIQLINYILEDVDPNQDWLNLADINEDGNINIQDIILIVDIILN